jgi:heme exporter protein C
MARKKDKWLWVLGGLAFAGIMVGGYLALVYAPPAAGFEGSAGLAQRIFYFHVPAAWTGFLAFFVTFVASIAYLLKGGRKWDILAVSSAEIGLFFTTMVVITGPIWAKPTWGVWWTWSDPKLVTAAILWLIYFGYITLRRMVDDEARRARFSAVLGIIGFADVPLVFGAARWWGESVAHPIVVSGGGFDVAPKMLMVLMFNLAVFTLLYVMLLALRSRVERLSDAVEALKGGE